MIIKFFIFFCSNGSKDEIVESYQNDATVTNDKKETPFHAAIADRNHSSLERLCKYVQETDGLNLASFLQPKQSSNEPTPIQLAIKEDNFRVLDVLMSYDLDLSTTKTNLDITKYVLKIYCTVLKLITVLQDKMV